jgi:hypothetical protein
MLLSTFRLRYALSILTLALASCEQTTSPSTGQDIADLVWKSDGSGLVGLIQQSLTSPRQYAVTLIDANGAITSTLNTSEKSTGTFSPALLLSEDNSNAIVELEKCTGANCISGAYRVALSSADAKVLAANVNLLTASPDQKEIVVLQGSGASARKLVTVLDYSVSPMITRQFFVDSIAMSRGLWLNDQKVALTISDSITDHYYVAIYDTGGRRIQSIPDAEVSLHGTAYVSATNELFVRQNNWRIARINLTTNTRTEVLSDSVSSMSVSRDGKTMVYILLTDLTNSLRVLNLATGATAVLSTDHALFSAISPAGDKVAYASYRSDSFYEVKVIPLVIP